MGGAPLPPLGQAGQQGGECTPHHTTISPYSNHRQGIPGKLSTLLPCCSHRPQEQREVQLVVDRAYEPGQPLVAWCGPQPNSRLLINVSPDRPGLALRAGSTCHGGLCYILLQQRLQPG